MNNRSRAGVRRRLRSLAYLELFNIPLQAGLWFGVIGFPVTAANAVGFALFALLLVEGAAYWLAKLRRLEAPGASLPGAGAFAALRVINVPILAAGVLFTVWAAVDDPGAGSWPGLGFALFAVLEHVNYFHTQLMYDTAEDRRNLRENGLRRAHLARDLDRAKGRAKRRLGAPSL
ncbi:hypothetical protein WEB32_12275 [Streptomyces netropsis]|uniref:Uncharacterized protein n=1 Tax=Streptomyces netropsis TaxID=55404 RepID=A0A7W7PBP0_STRNE|nr:hypothetical protein [Streptomyces netropsis]MBB4884179.1 hypothetical protein [Streptomyces netropsis]GGR05534.1 hypothetical protein GCM10010219_07390 [Streptomyces netropsis]